MYELIKNRNRGDIYLASTFYWAQVFSLNEKSLVPVANKVRGGYEEP